MRTQDRINLLNQAGWLIEEAITNIERAVQGTGRLEASTRIYILPNLRHWSSGGCHAVNLPMLIDELNAEHQRKAVLEGDGNIVRSSL